MKRNVRGGLIVKVLMLVGATGAVNSTLVSGMVNYMLGVEWKEDYRYKLIVEDERAYRRLTVRRRKSLLTRFIP